MFINHPELLSPIDLTDLCDKVENRLKLLEVVEDVNEERIKSLEGRVELCEKVFIKIMQIDTRIHTLEFNSDIPTTPSSAERIMDFEMRIQRLESLLLNQGANHE